MSKVLKKIVKGVKKVFKKVVKTVKKIVKSDIFKVVVAAAAIYFTAGAAAGLLKGGAAAAAGSGATSTVAAAAAPAANVSALGKIGAAGAKAAGIGKSASIVGKVASVGSKIGGAVSGMSTGQALLASNLIGTGGQMLSGYAQGQEQERERKRIEANRETQLNVYDSWNGQSNAYAGEGGVQYAQEGAPIQNVENKPAMAYDSSRNAWTPVAKASQGVA